MHDSQKEPIVDVERLKKRLDRERKARAEAEHIAENGLRSLYAKQQEIELLQDISSASNEAKSLTEALSFAIERICRHTGWPVGHVYWPDPEHSDVLISTGIWACSPPDKYDAFREKTADTPLAYGVGLPGRVLSTRKAVWIPDVSIDPNFPRAPWAMSAGLRAGYAFGVFVDGELAAVLEFFSRDRIEINPSLLDAMGHIATQISRVVERERYAEKIQFLAYHDTLTGLPNRRLLKDRLDIAIDQAARHGRQMAVLFLDLDRFKVVNDSLGHKGGDHLLVQVSNRLRDCVRKGDTVARWAGDEFVVVLAEVEHEDDAREIAERILDAMSTPTVVGEQELYVTFSIGGSLFPWCGNSPDTMLKSADIALYRAKQHGRNRYELFTDQIAQESESQVLLETNLRRAVARGVHCPLSTASGYQDPEGDRP